MFNSISPKRAAKIGGAFFFLGLSCVSLKAQPAKLPTISPGFPVLQMPPQRELVVQTGLVSEVTAMVAGPQDVLVSADSDRLAVWRHEGADLLWIRSLPSASAVALRVVNDQTILVGGSRKVWAYDLWSGKIVGEIEAPQAGRWQPGGADVLSAVGKTTLQIVSWDAQKSALELREVPLPAVIIEAVTKQEAPRGANYGLRDSGQNAGAVVAPNGKAVALWDDNLLFVAPLDLNAPRQIDLAPKPATGGVRRVVWSPDSSKIALSTYVKVPDVDGDSRLQLVEAISLKTLWSVDASTSAVPSWKPDGAQIYDEAAFDATNGQQLSNEAYGIGIWNADGSRLIRGGEGDFNMIYEGAIPVLAPDTDPKAKRQFRLTELGRSQMRGYPPYAASWSADGTRVLLQSNKPSGFTQMSVWSWPDLTPLTPNVGSDVGKVNIARWSQDGKKIVVSGEYAVGALDAATAQKLVEDRSFAQYSVASDLQITPSGDAYFRYTEFDGEGQTGALGGTFPAMPPKSRTVAFAPDGEMRALFYRFGERTEDRDGNYHTPLLWFLKDGEREIALPDEIFDVLGFSGDASTLWVSTGVSNQGKSKLRSFDAATGKILATIDWPVLEKGGYLQPRTASIAAGAPRFAFAGAQEVRIYDDKLNFVSLPISNAERAAVSPDGKFVIVAIDDFFEIWDVATAQRLSRLAILGVAQENPKEEKWTMQWIKLGENRVQMTAQAPAWLRWREGNNLEPVKLSNFKPAL